MLFAMEREGSVILYIGRKPYTLPGPLELVCPQNGNDARQLLQSRQLDLQEVWIQSDAPAPGMLDLVCLARKYYPGIPIRIIESSPDEALPETETQRLTLSPTLQPDVMSANINRI